MNSRTRTNDPPAMSAHRPGDRRKEVKDHVCQRQVLSVQQPVADEREVRAAILERTNPT